MPPKGKQNAGIQTLVFKRHQSKTSAELRMPEICPQFIKNKKKIFRFGYADDGGRYELLLDAISRGRIKLVRTMMQLLPPNSVADALTPAGENSLMLALRTIEDHKRRNKMLTLLTDNGADVKFVKQSDGMTIVHLCSGVIADRLSDLKWFVARWPVEMDVTKVDYKGNNALHYAVASGDIYIVAYLLRVAISNFGNLDSPNIDKLTPYLYANKLGHFEIAKLIDITSDGTTDILDEYTYSNSRANNSGRRSARDENDIMLPVLINHNTPARFDDMKMPVRNRTAIRKIGDEERLNYRLQAAIKKREQLLIRGQPEHLPRIPLPSAIIRKQTEESQMHNRSFANLDDTLALLPDYGYMVESRTNQPTIVKSHRPRKATQVLKNQPTK